MQRRADEIVVELPTPSPSHVLSASARTCSDILMPGKPGLLMIGTYAAINKPLGELVMLHHYTRSAR